MNTFAMPQPAEAEYQFKSKTVSIPVKYIVTAACLYMVIPIIIFFLTWLKWYIAILVSLGLLLGSISFLKDISKENYDTLKLPLRNILIVLLLICIWLYSMSYFFYQTTDQHGRNALLRDLCDYAWPVVYPETNTALVYYFTHWLVPALIGKLLSFTAANIALLVWNSLGVFLIFLSICIYIKPKKEWQVWIIIMILMLWNGLNEFGYIWVDILGKTSYSMGSGFGWPDAYYGYGYQYTPNDALLAWVYNQTIVPWLATSLFMSFPKIKSYAFMGLCALPYGPIPFVGLFVFLIADFFVEIKIHGIVLAIKSAMSIQNICACFTIFPVFFLFFRANISAAHIGVYVVPDIFGPKHIIFLIIFYLLEFGIYSLLIQKEYRHSLLFTIINLSLVFIPHIQLGYTRDFCMRASIPALFILMLLVIRYITVCSQAIKNSIATILLIICISISGFGVVKDWMVRIKAVRENNWIPLAADGCIVTYSDKRVGDEYWEVNFLVPEPENTTFFKYMAR